MNSNLYYCIYDIDADKFIDVETRRDKTIHVAHVDEFEYASWWSLQGIVDQLKNILHAASLREVEGQPIHTNIAIVIPFTRTQSSLTEIYSIHFEHAITLREFFTEENISG